jgi:hypothetical protein
LNADDDQNQHPNTEKPKKKAKATALKEELNFSEELPVGDATNSPTPKKSKSKKKAEPLAGAKAWHDARTNKATHAKTTENDVGTPSGGDVFLEYDRIFSSDGGSGATGEGMGDDANANANASDRFDVV